MTAKTPEALKAEIQLFCQGMEGEDSEILLADGFEEASIGIGGQYSKQAVAIYDMEKCIDILVDQFTENEPQDKEQVYLDAVEYFNFNVLQAWVGEYTPIFMSSWESLDEEKP